MESDQTLLQREYYRSTADRYDNMHLGDREHEFALGFMLSALRLFGFKSVLDVGSGTGRALTALKTAAPDQRVLGVEPSEELRARGYSKGLSEQVLIDGNALSLQFPDGSFDLVCSFGVLHHIPEPSRAIGEMLRVARSGIFISDNNDFGRGSTLSRSIKQALHIVGLWPLAEQLLTRGKGYRVTDDDGLWYSFSVFDHLVQIERSCAQVHMMNTDGRGPNLYRDSGHVAILGLKNR